MDFLGLIRNWVPMAKSVWFPSEKMPSGSVFFLGVREALGDYWVQCRTMAVG